MDFGKVKRFIGIDITNAGDFFLIHEQRFYWRFYCFDNTAKLINC